MIAKDKRKVKKKEREREGWSSCFLRKETQEGKKRKKKQKEVMGLL